VDAWLDSPHDEMHRLAKSWFQRLRDCGADVRELMHDGYPTVCVDDAAFAYVNAFKAHVNVGFYHGASLADPRRLLEGSGKRMRHVKIKWGEPVDARALEALIAGAYADVRARLQLS
jgi:hypothetical protein